MAKTSKYTKLQKQVSYDSGQTWEWLDEYQKGELIENNSNDCSYSVITRWNPSGSPYCQVLDLIQTYILQMSYDGGQTWGDVAPISSKTSVVEYNAASCRDIPQGVKLYASYNDASSFSAACDSQSELKSGDTRASSTTYSAMTSAIVGDCLTSIGAWALSDCDSLRSVDVGSGITRVGIGAFARNQSLSSITFTNPSAITFIGDYAFSGTPIESFTITDSVTTWGDNSFNSCKKLKNITIGSGVTSIPLHAFMYCSLLDNVVIPNNVTSIGSGAFIYCSNLKNITLPNTITSIGSSAFDGCAFTSFTIPSGVTVINMSTFFDNPMLSTVTIPSGVTSIGFHAFALCRNLTSITIYATTPPTLDSKAFRDTNSTFKIYVPSASVDDYKSASTWEDYSSRIQAIPT